MRGSSILRTQWETGGNEEALRARRSLGTVPEITTATRIFMCGERRLWTQLTSLKCFMAYLVEEELDAPFVTPGAEVGSVSRNYTEADLCSI